MNDRGALDRYRGMRHFGRTEEPAGDGGPRSRKGAATGRVGRAALDQRSTSRALTFVVQRHAARRLHFDLRLELDGVLKSWAVPKGPSLVAGERRLAVHVEDHPFEYRSFEGAIPRSEYGGGWVFVWDAGTWSPVGDPHAGLEKGHLSFELTGAKLRGRFALVRTRAGDGKQWLLFKAKDDEAVDAREGDVAAPPALPALGSIAPELATLVEQAPRGDAWVVEPKLDGYRALASVEGGTARIASRSRQDWTRRFPSIRDAIAALPVTSAVLDGEICVNDDAGIPRFELLQQALSKRPPPGAAGSFVYYVFDLLFADGEDLRSRPLRVRKAILGSILDGVGAPLSFVRDASAADAKRLLAAAERSGLEGLVAKRREAPYAAGRTRDWRKLKVTRRQELVVVGWLPEKSRSAGLGALLVAVHDAGALRYAGKVGTGFTRASRAELERRLEPLAVDASAAIGAPRARGVRWVRPVLVAEVRFGEWTRAGKVRHASFVGLRDDKPSVEVMREAPPAAKAKSSATRAARREEEDVAGVAISHARRVIDAASGLRKIDLARYMETVAKRMLSYAAGRALALVRCPQGTSKACFFQKRRTQGMPPSIASARIGEHEVLHVDDAAGLLALVQFGAIELHGWGARVADPDRPDWIVMDLDPDEALPFSRVVDAARAMRDTLRSLGLVPFVKTTGGKGLHVVAPLVLDLSFDDVKRVARAIALKLAKDAPRAYTSAASKSSRVGKIFVDYLRNGRGATAVLPYSARARPGLPVAWPIAWRDLGHVDPAEITVANAGALLARRKDPWAGFFEAAARLPPELRGERDDGAA